MENDEEIEVDDKPSSGASASPPAPAAAAPPASSPDPKALAELLKSSALLNPALMAINPQLYAMQVAQLQAGLQQLAAAAAAANSANAKKVDEEDPVNLRASPPPLQQRSRTESPLDLSGCKSPPAAAPAAAPGLASGLLGNPASAPPGIPLNWSSNLSLFHPLFRQQREALAAAAASASPSSPLASDPLASKHPLERMSAITAAAAAVSGNNRGHPRPIPTAAPATAPAGSTHQHHRQSAWQSQWKNKVPETSSDIFKCVCCKLSFPSLQALTAHMRDTGEISR